MSKKPLSQLIFGCSLSAAYVPLLGYTCHHSVSCCQTALWPVCISSFLEALQAGYRYRTQHTFTEWAIKVSAADRNTFCFVLNWSQTGQTCWTELIYDQSFLYLFYASTSPTGQRISVLHEWMTTWTFYCSFITTMFNRNRFIVIYQKKDIKMVWWIRLDMRLNLLDLFSQKNTTVGMFKSISSSIFHSCGPIDAPDSKA